MSKVPEVQIVEEAKPVTGYSPQPEHHTGMLDPAITEVELGPYDSYIGLNQLTDHLLQPSFGNNLHVVIQEADNTSLCLQNSSIV